MNSSLALFGAAMLAGALSCPALTITSLGVPVTENFNTLAISGTSSALPAGWILGESGTNANFTYTAGTGSGTTGDTYSFGAASSSERALGGLQSGTLIPVFGVEISNSTGLVIAGLDISYTGEIWRIGTANRADQLDFQYSIDATSLTTGTWLDLNSLDFISSGSATTGARDGNAAANRTSLSSSLSGLSINSGDTIWLRWNDINATGSDDGLAVDDFSITAHGTPTSTPEAGAGLMMSGLSIAGLLLCAEISRHRRGRFRLVA